ncbi:hypothetical protein ABIB25_002723 [Nakamurella sp. UYEF19]|uniref:putative glycolipid-binding domain-containing protein n=1 Tax=Nakamurella sp. UYEF19 TaxID=1756392 RepID=UPI00339948EF
MNNTSTSTRMLAWTSDDQHRLETVRVVLTDRGLRASGHIVSALGDPFGVSYSLLADPEGRTRRLTVQTDSGTGERSLNLTRAPGGQWVADHGSGPRTLSLVEAAQDIDLLASAFTNSLAIRRMGLHRAVGSATVTVASVGCPDPEVSAVQHVYRTVSTDANGAVIAYSGPLGDRELIIDADGFVLHFPGLSDRLR